MNTHGLCFAPRENVFAEKSLARACFQVLLQGTRRGLAGKSEVRLESEGSSQLGGFDSSLPCVLQASGGDHWSNRHIAYCPLHCGERIHTTCLVSVSGLPSEALA